MALVQAQQEQRGVEQQGVGVERDGALVCLLAAASVRDKFERFDPVDRSSYGELAPRRVYHDGSRRTRLLPRRSIAGA
jgi:hypothetical protein